MTAALHGVGMPCVQGCARRAWDGRCLCCCCVQRWRAARRGMVLRKAARVLPRRQMRVRRLLLLLLGGAAGWQATSVAGANDDLWMGQGWAGSTTVDAPPASRSGSQCGMPVSWQRQRGCWAWCSNLHQAGKRCTALPSGSSSWR